MARTAKFLDDIKDLDFKEAYKGGLVYGLNDIMIPDNKKNGLILKPKKKLRIVWNNYLMGLITDNERYNQVIDIWTRINSQITSYIDEAIGRRQAGFQFNIYDDALRCQRLQRTDQTVGWYERTYGKTPEKLVGFCW
jgi:DNA-directed RNA polymerase subunit beta'